MEGPEKIQNHQCSKEPSRHTEIFVATILKKSLVRQQIPRAGNPSLKPIYGIDTSEWVIGGSDQLRDVVCKDRVFPKGKLRLRYDIFYVRNSLTAWGVTGFEKRTDEQLSSGPDAGHLDT